LRNGNGIFGNIDLGLVLIYLILIFLGLSNIYSSVFDESHASLFDLSTEHGKQVMWIGISLFLGLIILLLDGTFIIKNSYWIYGVTMLLLLLVLFTAPIHGARSWFGFGGVGIQPAEFAKIGVCMALARHLSVKGLAKKRRQESRRLTIGNLFGYAITSIQTESRTLLILALPSILVLLQPDAGTFIIFTSFILVLYREGYAGNILLFGIVSVIIAVITLLVADANFFLPFTKVMLSGKFGIFLILLILGLIFFLIIKQFVVPRERKTVYKALVGSIIVSIVFINFVEIGYTNILKSHQKTRIDLVLGKIQDPNGHGYNINRAKAAIGSGGFLGKGYKQAKLANASQKHVPEQSTDFIFCTWSEERGFLGSFLLVIIYMSLLLKIVIIAERQRSSFTRIYAYAVGGIFFYHFMINIGMAIGLAPVIGIPLPFFSYGGSGMMSFSILIFILLKLDSERKTVLH
jgi:rod shape determining protein RodA